MCRKEIQTNIRILLEDETGYLYPEFNESARLLEDLGLDSVDITSLVLQLENHFHVRLHHRQLTSLISVKDLIDLLEEKIPQQPDQFAA